MHSDGFIMSYSYYHDILFSDLYTSLIAFFIRKP